MERKKCMVCSGDHLSPIIELGMHPYADTFISKNRITDPDILFDLTCNLCTDCGHIQLKTVTNDVERYQLHEYSYTSANSNYSRGYWKSYANNVSSLIKNENKNLIVEIGSNDGYLLSCFQQMGYRCLGVDASPAMATIAKSKGVETKEAVFDHELAKKIKNEYGNASLVIANNVVNHSNNIIDFFKGVSEILEKDGLFIFEQPYWLSAIEQNRFDQIYHEHVSYLTMKSVMEITKRTNLVIIKADVTEYHGGSLRITCKKGSNQLITNEIKKHINNENKNQLFEIEKYKEFNKKLQTQKLRVMKNIYSYLIEGRELVAVGAAAKGNTILNFYGLDASIVSFVTDSSEHKIGKYTPGTRIKIYSDEQIRKLIDPIVLILSWNISSILEEKLKKINDKIKFIYI